MACGVATEDNRSRRKGAGSVIADSRVAKGPIDYDNRLPSSVYVGFLIFHMLVFLYLVAGEMAWEWYAASLSDRKHADKS